MMTVGAATPVKGQPFDEKIGKQLPGTAGERAAFHFAVLKRRPTSNVRGGA
jgi:hypothetical protein